MASGLELALVAGSFTVAGVLLKIGYDYLAERRSTAIAQRELFLTERRTTYESFFERLRAERDYWNRLHDLLRTGADGGTVSQEVMESFPPSPMAELTASVEEIRRLARTYQVITTAEPIISLFIDLAQCEREAVQATLQSPPESADDSAALRSDYELRWFLLQRFLDDREREFVFAYRSDLGIGAPSGAPADFPMPPRPWPSPAAGETAYRMATRAAQAQGKDDGADPHTPA